MRGVKNLYVLSLDIFQTIDDGTLEFLYIFFVNSGGASHQVDW